MQSVPTIENLVEQFGTPDIDQESLSRLTEAISDENL
jgi:hypothetical protein